MRNIYEVIREKEAELQQLLKELEALRLSARLLADERDGKEVKVEAEPPKPVRAGVPIASLATDTEVVLASVPRRQFP